MAGKVADSRGEYDVTLAPMFGERFGKACDVIGTRAEAADKIGISVPALQRYVAERVVPPFDAVARLSALSRVRMEWLAFNTGPMYHAEAYAIEPRRESQSARHSDAKLDSGLLHSAVRITEETLKKFGLRDQLDSIQKADLVQIVFNDLARGAADDAALASLGRILAINRKP